MKIEENHNDHLSIMESAQAVRSLLTEEVHYTRKIQ
jgi:hypothetical protein